MNKRLISILLILCMVIILMPKTAAFAADTATPSDTKFVINGKSVSVTAAYVISNTNYLQLRAIAAMLNGTSAQFDVSWDGQYAVIEPGKPYSGTITETRLKNTMDVRKSDTKFKMNGKVVTFADARLIDGGTNYIQLREFAQKLTGTASQFNVYWDSAAGQAVIQPGVAYTGNPSQGDSATPMAKGGTKRTINMDNLLTLELSNTYAYSRVLGYDPSGATIVNFVVVPEGTEVKCTKYALPYGQGAEYMIAPYNIIYFENGSAWPTVTYASEYDDREWEALSQGSSVKLTNGIEYSFSGSTDDKAITTKYGKVGAVFYIVRVFVVPDEIAAKIGGPAPNDKLDDKTTLQEFYVPPGAGSAPVTYIPDPGALQLSYDGWYELMYDHSIDVTSVDIDTNGNAELREGKAFYMQKKGNNQVTLRMADGRYLGIDGTAADGVRVMAVSNPYLWNMYFENNGGFFDNNRYSLRPSTNTGLALTASGTIKEGTPVILSAQKSMDVPKNSEFTFFSTDAPQSLAFTYTSDELEDDGIYYIKASKDPRYVIDVLSKSKGDGAKFIVYQNNGGYNQRFRITRVKDNQYTIQSVHSGKWLTSGGKKGTVLTQSGVITDKSAITYTITKQENGAYRIMDSKGLYLGISGGKIVNFTNIILWTEASDASQMYLFEKIK